MSQVNDRYRIAWWNAASWVLVGLSPTMIAGRDDPGTRPYWSLALVLVLGLSFAAALRFRAARTPFLLILVAGLAVASFLRTGDAALYVVALPHFWLYAGSTRRAIVLSGAGAVATVAGALVAGAEPGSGNNVVTLLAYPASVLLGLSVHQMVRRADERAQRLAAELEVTQRELAEAHRREGAAGERERLAREIHDTLAQGFASIVVLAEAARSGLASDPDRSARQLTSIENTARENLTEARILVGAGSAPEAAPAAGSVAQTLRRTLDRFTEDTGIAVEAELPDLDCDQTTRVALLRCTQESLANVRKHADATTVCVFLAADPYGEGSGIELEITDDGKGFVPAEAHGFGLDGMRRRLAELGGELTVTSSPGEGTRVLAAFPASLASNDRV
ncbi:sensor histidine kinase [Actinomadura barringtoniae]|uniref:Oxygen sensor histidine kinase NreB n=1 Tax=Actinomadura barringtoniae TaxID=1427535 RepID=A0A939PDG9_9ACTN|nr:sensor histidine kinase [Actinomadura barringtoniae]MBO2447244.1 sensor histidine kinase [Actinomadura barringtoniae]